MLRLELERVRLCRTSTVPALNKCLAASKKRPIGRERVAEILRITAELLEIERDYGCAGPAWAEARSLAAEIRINFVRSPLAEKGALLRLLELEVSYEFA